MKRKKKAVSKAAIIAILITLIVLIAKMGQSAEPKKFASYTVEPGDTLYSIATEKGASDWRKWVYETCENNGIKKGASIYPGQVLIIEVEGDGK